MLYLIHKSQYMGAVDVVSQVKAEEGIKELKKFTDLRPSAFTGITIIANQLTPIYWDSKGYPSWFNLLVACGFDSRYFLEVFNLSAHVQYNPGDACLSLGQILSHAVTGWKGTGQIAYARRQQGSAWMSHRNGQALAIMRNTCIRNSSRGILCSKVSSRPSKHMGWPNQFLFSNYRLGLGLPPNKAVSSYSSPLI